MKAIPDRQRFVAEETLQAVFLPKKLYHTVLKTTLVHFLIELQIRYLCLHMHRTMHDVAYKSNRRSLS